MPLVRFGWQQSTKCCRMCFSLKKRHVTYFLSYQLRKTDCTMRSAHRITNVIQQICKLITLMNLVWLSCVSCLLILSLFFPYIFSTVKKIIFSRSFRSFYAWTRSLEANANGNTADTNCNDSLRVSLVSARKIMCFNSSLNSCYAFEWRTVLSVYGFVPFT